MQQTVGGGGGEGGGGELSANIITSSVIPGANRDQTCSIAMAVPVLLTVHPQREANIP